MFFSTFHHFFFSSLDKYFMYSNSTFLTPSTSISCLCVFNNRLPRLARYLQAVFIVTNSFGRLNILELELELDFYVPPHSIQEAAAGNVNQKCVQRFFLTGAQATSAGDQISVSLRSPNRQKNAVKFVSN